MKKRIIVIGGGFGGLSFCKNISHSKFDVILIDKTNHHLFQPLLYQVAIAGLSPSDIAYPLRTALANKNIEVIYQEVTGIDFSSNKVLMGTKEISYDFLVVAAGASTNFYNNQQLQANSFQLKTIEDAIKIRNHLLNNLEQAEYEKQESLLNFVICGGGPTGVELSGAICELIKNTINNEFKKIKPKDVNVYLIERGDSILTSFPEPLQKFAIKDLNEMGVNLLLAESVESYENHIIKLKNQEIKSNTLIWVAGVKGVDFIQGVPKSNSNKVIVNKFCQSVYENVYFIGDVAHFEEKNKPLPGVSPVAIQQGKYVAQKLNTGSNKEFYYLDKGNMATIGRNKAIADFYLFSLTGKPAWIAWLLVHLLFLIGFRNRISVVINWIYSYFSYKKGSRLITK